MPAVRSTVDLLAPPRAVAGILRDAEAAAAALHLDGHRLTTDVRLLSPGDEARFAARVLPGLRIRLRTRVTAVSPTEMVSVLARGPLRELVHRVSLTPLPAGTRIVDELRWVAPLGPLGRLADVLVLRRLCRRVLAARAAVLAERVAALPTAPVVVATAIVRDGRVLAARRARPPELAGRWELPGGRVEPGEPEAAAVVRECREELGAAVTVTGRLGTDLPIAAGVLRVHVADLRPGAPEPRALEHSALCWVGPDEVGELDWVDADRAVVPDLVALLAERSRS